MCALKFTIESPEDKAKKRIVRKIISYSVLVLFLAVFVYAGTWYFGLDRIPPEITLESPADNFETQNTKVTLNYTFKDESEVNCEVILNGQVVGKTKSVEVELKIGENTWKVSCIDDSYYSNNATSRTRKIFVLKPLTFKKINVFEANELRKGVIQLYEGTSETNMGKLLFEILPNNGGLLSYNETSEKHLAISLWGENSIQEQKIKINNVTISIPRVTNITGIFALYIDTKGNTYHSYSNHDYNNATNGGRNSMDLSLEEALTSQHRTKS